MSVIKPVTKKKNYEYIIEQIKEAILTGEFPEGSRVPTEDELSKQINVGRGCVREALIHLQNQNILKASPGRGTYITENARARIFCSQLNDVFNAKENTDSLISAISAIEPVLVSKINVFVGSKKMKEINALMSVTVGNEENAWELREALCELSGDTVLFAVYRAMLETYVSQNAPSVSKQEISEFEKVVDALQKRSIKDIVENWPAFNNN